MLIALALALAVGLLLIVMLIQGFAIRRIHRLRRG